MHTVVSVSVSAHFVCRGRACGWVRCSRSRPASAIAVGRPLYERPAGRRFDRDAPENRQEAEMLLDGASRLSDDGIDAR